MRNLTLVFGNVTDEQLTLLNIGKQSEVVRLAVEKLNTLNDELDEASMTMTHEALTENIQPITNGVFGISTDDVVRVVLAEDVYKLVSDPVASPEWAHELYNQVYRFFPNLLAFWWLHDDWAEDDLNNRMVDLV